MRHEMIPFGTSRELATATPFGALQNRMNRLFDEFWRDVDSGVPMAGPAGFAPQVDVGEDERNVYVTADMPGLGPDDLEVDFAERTLRIAGEKKAESQGEGHRYSVTERSYGRFERHVPIARDIDPDRVEATFENGVLTVTLPKTEQDNGSRKIEVKRSA